MTTVYLAPGAFGAGGQFFTLAGLPLNQGLIYTYSAGTTTPLATYTTSTGNVQNANPIVLDVDGRPPNEIWITSDSYRFDLKDSLGNLIKTYDNLVAPDITAAQLAASSGSSLVGFIQSGTGAVARTTQAKEREIFSVTDFGAKGDGSTDDTAAINLALAAAALAGAGSSVGREVRLPAGEYVFSSQLIIPNKVRLVGENKSASLLKADSSFPTSTPMVRLGDGSSFVFNCRTEKLSISCNNVTGSTGIYSTDAQEGCGAFNCAVTSYMSYGINFDDSGSTNYNDHYLCDELELYASASATNSVGFHYKGLKNGGQLRRITVSANAGAADQKAGVHIEGTGAAGAHVTIIGLNTERVTDGLLIDTNGGATVVGVSLNTSGTSVVNVNSTQFVSLSGIQKGAGTNAVNNQTISQTVTDAKVPWYVCTPSASGYQVFTSAGNTSTTGNVVTNDTPVWKIKSTATSGAGGRSNLDLFDGNNHGWRLRFGADGTGRPFQILPYTSGSIGSTLFAILNTGAIRNLTATNGPVGTLTLGAAATTVVSNSVVTASSIILLFPTNAAAATLVGSAASPYISAKSASTSFTVATGNASAAAGTETFNYILLN